MKKRGQLNQIFVFIFIAIVIALLFLFGSDMIKKVFNFGKDVETKKFVDDLEKQFELVKTYNIGSRVSLEDIQVPKQVEEICFYEGKFSVQADKLSNRTVPYLRTGLASGCVSSLEDLTAEKKIVGSETIVLVK